ncbi:MAG: endonuclease domain-containing protein [Bacteroidaceae bacterium]|nr:endonuclease domain-containing protein [Bacteroidaceae bacterium]
MIDEIKWAACDRYSLLKGFARQNRKNPTDAEIILWQHIRGKNLKTKFFRQYIIADYIVDFVSLESNLIIEVDGAYHSEYEQLLYDKDRTRRLESLGFKVIRFTNNEVFFQTEHVLEIIKKELYEKK